MRTILSLSLSLSLAACSNAPGDSDDQPVDGSTGNDAAREFTTDCVRGAAFEATLSDGTKSRAVYWTATVDPPFAWDKVTVRLCNLEVWSSTSLPCPSGATCTGGPPPPPQCIVRPFYDIITADGAGRVDCGFTTETVNVQGQVTGRGGQRWMHATFRVDG